GWLLGGGRDQLPASAAWTDAGRARRVPADGVASHPSWRLGVGAHAVRRARSWSCPVRVAGCRENGGGHVWAAGVGSRVGGGGAGGGVGEPAAGAPGAGRDPAREAAGSVDGGRAR